LLGIERLEERAASLAAAFIVEAPRHRRAHNLLSRFQSNAKALRSAYRILASDLGAGQPMSPASEWFLDNFHLIVSEVRDVHLHLPRNFFRKLPVLAAPEQHRQIRVYAMAVELLRHSDSRLDPQQLRVFLNSFQRVAPLTIGELWAWPSVLKLALIENLRRLTDEMLDARVSRLAVETFLKRFDRPHAPHEEALPPTLEPVTALVELLHRLREYGVQFSAVQAAIDRHLASQSMTPEEILRIEQRRQAATQESVANVITSLRLCST
jgi:cyclic beta-1,2-glucan synthetase